MSKSHFLLYCLLLKGLFGWGQANEDGSVLVPEKYYYKRAYIGVSLGVAIPMGSFSSKNIEIENSAFSKNGKSLNVLDFGIRLGENLGVCGYYFKVNNTIDTETLRKSLSPPNEISFQNVYAGSYELKGLFLGLLVNKKNNVADLDLKFLLGFGNFFIPQIQVKGINNNTDESYSEVYFPENNTSIGLGVGLALRVHLTEHLDFITNTNYLIFEGKFKQKIDTQGIVNYQTTRLNYEVLTFNLGIAYRFIDDYKSLFKHAANNQ